MASLNPLESDSVLPLDRITTDAVQRRFKSDRNAENKESVGKKRDEENNSYFCSECNKKLQNEEDLKSHFEEIQHTGGSACNSCSKPINVYLHRKKTEFYHMCKCLKDKVLPK